MSTKEEPCVFCNDAFGVLNKAHPVKFAAGHEGVPASARAYVLGVDTADGRSITHFVVQKAVCFDCGSRALKIADFWEKCQ